VACFSPLRDEDEDLPARVRAIRAGTLVGAQLVKRTYTTPAGATRMGWRLDEIWGL
jgi:hypothetical protein